MSGGLWNDSNSTAGGDWDYQGQRTPSAHYMYTRCPLTLTRRAPQGIGPVHVQYNVLGEPHDPAAAEGQTPPPGPLIAAALHDCFGDSASSSDDEPMDDDLSFVKGSATHGDVHDFSYRMLRLIRGGRKAAYRLPDQLQAWAARCDKTTDRAVQTAIATDFVLAAGGGGVCRQAILH